MPEITIIQIFRIGVYKGAMDNEAKRRLFRTGNMEKEDCARRLMAGRIAAGYDKAKDFAAVIETPATTYNSQEKGAAFPSRQAIAELYSSHNIDFNFVWTGEFSHLPLHVQKKLADALSDIERAPDRRHSSS